MVGWFGKVGGRGGGGRSAVGSIREGGLAAKTGRLGRARGAVPGDFAPVLQGEEMVIAAGEMGAEDQRELARGAGGGERADFAAAAGA